MKITIRVLLTVLFLCLTAGSALGDKRYRGMALDISASAQDIADLKAWGANLVRIQLSFNNADSAGEEEYMAWLDSALATLDAQLPVFEQYGMKVVLDLHSPPGGLVTHTSPAQQRIFSEKWAQEALVKAWQKIAVRYSGRSVFYGYDILNEPAYTRVAAGLQNWSALSSTVAKAIRAADPLTPIIVKPSYGNPARLKSLKLPKVKRVILSVHMYYNLKFIQQGLYGNKMGLKYPTKTFDKADLKKFLDLAKNYQKKNKVWKVYIGEFTVARWAPGKSGASYLRDVISIFEKNKWDWTYHAWREATVWSLEIGADPSNETVSDTDRARVVRGYFGKNR